jgi:hypothetical protein
VLEFLKDSHMETPSLPLGPSVGFSTELVLMINRCGKFMQASEPSGLSVSNYQSTTTDEGKITNGISSKQTNGISSKQRQKSQTSRTL